MLNSDFDAFANHFFMHGFSVEDKLFTEGVRNFVFRRKDGRTIFLDVNREAWNDIALDDLLRQADIIIKGGMIWREEQE